MPDMDGLEATTEIRIREELTGVERTPIVALDGPRTQRRQRPVRRAGMDDYVNKPIEANRFWKWWSESPESQKCNGAEPRLPGSLAGAPRSVRHTQFYFFAPPSASGPCAPASPREVRNPAQHSIHQHQLGAMVHLVLFLSQNHLKARVFVAGSWPGFCLTLSASTSLGQSPSSQAAEFIATALQLSQDLRFRVRLLLLGDYGAHHGHEVESHQGRQLVVAMDHQRETTVVAMCIRVCATVRVAGVA